MTSLDPVARPQRNMGKRKRRASSEASGSLWPSPSDGVVNPFSRSPSERLQLSVAGLSDTDEDPTRGTRDFPHRALDRGTVDGAQESETEVGGESQWSDTGNGSSAATPSLGKPSKSRAAEAGRGSHLDVLLRSVHQFLDRGEVAKAARAYGLILQLRPGSRPIDVRHHHLWAIGAEILMREGEDSPSRRLAEQPQPQQHDEAADDASKEASPAYTGIRMPARWGSPANMNKVRAYFENLIQKHPYDHKFTRNVSALDFQLALLGCEIYNVHAEHAAALARADDDAGTWGDNNSQWDVAERLDETASDDVHGLGPDELEARREAHRERLRAQARTAMRDITRKMDVLMQQLPFYKNNHFLRLRATASLYMADLFVPTSQMTSSQRYDVDAKRRLERQAAVDALRRLEENGGELDTVAQQILDGQMEKGEEQPQSPLYSSLPIRGT